ncbi:hypothetical protein TI39_contig4214g00010 [Zymoseptoria brevis]|uniref:Uncharacterized protein n=1 Tax=Zymoseptoria brevis TaxID=1047168 RepID=A0A0F4G9T7_9PEZI|nr:hypothetical protein TI39_contig4214g00010 [Zymoseptoria brevis]
MADSAAVVTGSDGPADETPNQRQARLRREKRQKKMTEQGEDRLAKIKALNGGIAPPDEVLGGPVPRVASVADDPDEVDISSHFSTPARGAQGAKDPLAAAMLQMEQERRAQGGSGNGEDEDPFAKMMQQMMGAMGGQGDPNNPNAGPQDMPPMLQSLMGGAMGGGQQGPAQPAPAGSVYLWRIVHAIFAFILAFYICLTSTFNGTQTSRYQTLSTEGNGLGPRLFIIFTSAELVLQSTRYFMEKGQLQGGGPLAMVANSGFVPEPYANYIRIVGRYIGIAKTIFSDVMVIVFVLGCIAWWNGEGVATIA